MDLKKGTIYLLIGLFFVFGRVGTSISADDSGGAAGEKTYTQKCQICHGINGQGNGIAGSSFNPPPTDFTDAEFWKKTSHEQMAQVILNGKGGMPAFDLTPDKIKNVIAYLKKTFKK